MNGLSYGGCARLAGEAEPSNSSGRREGKRFVDGSLIDYRKVYLLICQFATPPGVIRF